MKKIINYFNNKNRIVLMSSLFALLTVITLILTIMFSSSQNFSNEYRSPTKAKSKDKEHASYAIVNMGAEPITLNPLKATDQASLNILRHINEGLVRLDTEGNPVPAVAESWEVSKDNLVWTFKLRKNSYWKDGTQVKAKDFVYTFTQLLKGNGALAYREQMKVFKNAEAFINGKADIKDVGFKANDDFTLTLTLEAPVPGFLTMLAGTQFVPINSKFYEENIEDYGVEPDKIFFNGPWYPKEWFHNERIVLVKNNYYWNFDKVKIDQLLFLSSGNTESKISRLQSEDYDLIYVSNSEIKNYQDAGFTVQSIDDGSSIYLEFNTSHPITSNVHLRRALALGINRKEFINSIFTNSPKEALSLVNPKAFYDNLGEFKIDDTNISDTKDINEIISLAKEELNKAKKDLSKEQLNSITLTVDNSATSVANANLIASQWKNILGIDVKVEALSFAERVTKIQDNSYQIMINTWDIQYPDLLNVLKLFDNNNINNFTNYMNEDFINLLNEIKTTKNLDERNAKILDAFKILKDDMPVAPLYYRQNNYILTSRVKDIIIDSYRNIDFYFAYTETKSTPTPATSTPSAEATEHNNAAGTNEPAANE